MAQDQPNTNIEIDPQTITEAFTQSEYWGEFQKSLGKTVHYFKDSDWSALCIEQKTTTGVYWLVPYGPYAQDNRALNKAITELVKLAKKAGCLWLRVEPRLENAQIKQRIARRAPKTVQPEHTTMLDLRVDEETLYARLGKTNRQRVNRQKREPQLVFWTSTDPDDAKKFVKMLGQVSKRTGAIFYDEEYLRAQAMALMPNGHMRFEFVGLKPGKPLAGTVIHDYKGMATYTYAASIPEAREYGAANLLIWNAMLNAKARGNKTFDFWGIAPPNADAGHPWLGFTSFKRSFGTVDVAFGGTWDIPLSPQYVLYRKKTQLAHVVRQFKQRLQRKRSTSR